MTVPAVTVSSVNPLPPPPARRRFVLPVLLLLSGFFTVRQAGALPLVTLTHDDTVITQSCEIVIPPGTVLRDANSNGVLRIAADRVTVRFGSRSELRGAPEGTPGDQLRGQGIRIDGHRDVRILGAAVHGFFNGLVAVQAHNLIVDGGDFSDNYRQHLKSTPLAEDGADWLFPHHNDTTKWRDQYGGAICLESSDGVTVRNVRIRRGQNGIILDRVDGSQVYDNDCSFLSGWGLALWRSSRNVVARNAFDFCVRGHVEGVYNRGQDSAGILCFEQSNDNIFAENSATHGGDGFFGFAGREALGEHWLETERQRLRRETGREDVDALLRVPPEVARDFSARGCNRNILLGNDFSYAPAHGIEMTFSEGNIFARNRLVENAICGIWGGYCSGTLIAGNEITGNGGMAYGLERGGINMEHASGNRIVGNTFRDNKCAIHLWWDADTALLESPGVAGNYHGVSSNVIARNTFSITPDHPFRTLRPNERLVVLHLRDDGTGHVRDNFYLANRVTLTATNAVEFAVKPGTEPITTGPTPAARIPKPRLPGRNRPVGARPELRGRHQIVMDDWGPWDHSAPLVRPGKPSPNAASFEVLGLPEPPRVSVLSGAVTPSVTRGTNGSWEVSLAAPAGVTAYQVRLTAANLDRTLAGTLVAAEWEAVFFPWTIDPREDLAGWRRQAGEPAATRARLASLDLPYGWGGPRDQSFAANASPPRERFPGGDRFGMIARTRLQLPAGTWRFRTLSDDGIRITVAGRTVLENWTWHGPTSDEALFTQPATGEVDVEVEHFEIDGYAVLRLEVEPVSR